MPILAGRVTALDRDAGTFALGSTTFTLASGVTLRGLEVGTSVSVLYEKSEGGAPVAIELLRLPY
jgi:hypothetical protein